MNMMLFKHYQRVTHEIKLPASNVIKTQQLGHSRLETKPYVF